MLKSELGLRTLIFGLFLGDVRCRRDSEIFRLNFDDAVYRVGAIAPKNLKTARSDKVDSRQAGEKNKRN